MARPFCIWTQDLATRTGYAYWKVGMPRPVWNHVDLPKTGEEIGRFLKAYRTWFFKRALEIEPTVVLMEAAALFNSAKGATRTDDRNIARKLLGLANECETNTLVYGEMIQEPVDVRELPHKTMMVHWVGSGQLPSKTGKEFSRKAAAARGWKVACDDEADALGLLNYFVDTWKDTLELQVPWDTRPCPRPDWLNLPSKTRVIG